MILPFKDYLKNKLEAEGLDYKKGYFMYNLMFKNIRDIMRSETHAYDLTKYQLIIGVPFFGRFITKFNKNTLGRITYNNKIKRKENAQSI